ncbi:MAG: methyltransferase RsmF C-terminal domain-like protein [Candidatus Woesearchaeota archaeon]
MATLHVLNSKQVKEILGQLHEQWGITVDTPYVWYIHPKHQDIYVLSTAAKHIEFEHLRINNLGLYVAHIDKQNMLRLSIEASQLWGPQATKGVISLDDTQYIQWLRGQDIAYTHPYGYVLVKHGDDFMGCGKIKDDMLLNFVPKARRITAKDLPV